jgi:hypothetical protein
VPALAVLSGILGCGALAGPMVHHIEAVHPRAGALGTDVEVTLEGAYITEPRGVLFFRPGIECIGVKQLPSLPAPRSTIHGGFIQDKVTATFRIAPDAAPGRYPFKLRTATELSTTATFIVTKYPCIDEQEAARGENDSLAKAQPVPMNTTVRGRMTSTQEPDVDLYKITAKAGEHLSVEVDSTWISDKLYADNEFDLAVRILDAEGKELVRNDDSALHLQDPIASIITPGDGDYYVEVKQRLMKAADRVNYTASIGNNLRPLAVYPAGGKRGETLQASLLGDPAGSIQAPIPLPDTPGDFQYFHDMPSPLPMRVSNYDNVLESGAETPVPNLPAALNGVIAKPGETDSFTLNVKKGERWMVRVFGRSLGTPLDPRIAIRAADEPQPEVEADDSTMADRGFPSVARQIQRKEMLDPSVVWEPKKDGAYVLSISDMRGIGSTDSVYRIEIEPPPDRIDAFIHARIIDSVECPRINGITIPSGDRCAVTVYLADGQGSKYPGDVDLVAEDLPEGVTMQAPRVRKGQRSVQVVFAAEPHVKPRQGLLRIKCRAVDGTPLLSDCQQSFAFVNHSGGHAWQSFTVGAFAFAVTDPPPYSIEVTHPRIALSQNGELPLAVHVRRHAGFDEPVEIQADWTPDGMRGEPTVTIPAGQSEGVLKVFADANTAPSVWQAAVTSSTTGGSYYLGAGRIRTASSLFPIEVSEPYVLLKNKPASVRREDHAEVRWDVEIRKPFAGTATAALLGLPKGVSVVKEALLTADSKQLTFEINASADALLGQYKELACELTFTINGELIRQRLGKGILRVDPALSRAP